MNINTLDLEIGDIVFLHRPIYNKSDEIIPVEKKIRPYVILNIYNDNLLVVGLTSKNHDGFTYKVREGSYAKINDLYLINNRELVNLKGKVEDTPFKNLIACIYFAIKRGESSASVDIQNLFLEKYQDKMEEDIAFLVNKCYKKPTTFKEYDIVKLKDKKYIIDKVVEDGFFSYLVIDDNKLEIDFNRRIMLPKEAAYYYVKSISKEEYDQEREKFFMKNHTGDYIKCKKIFIKN